jgi:hypothetical protein
MPSVALLSFFWRRKSSFENIIVVVAAACWFWFFDAGCLVIILSLAIASHHLQLGFGCFNAVLENYYYYVSPLAGGDNIKNSLSHKTVSCCH